jgi:DNA-binding NtrC family response regulator
MNTHIQTRIASPTIDPGEQSVHPVSLDERLREVERDLISWALRVTHGNKSKAADLLRVKRSTLGDRIARCGLIVEAGERRGGC